MKRKMSIVFFFECSLSKALEQNYWESSVLLFAFITFDIRLKPRQNMDFDVIHVKHQSEVN